MEGKSLDQLEKMLRSARIQEVANNRTKTLTRMRLYLDKETKWSNPHAFNAPFKSLIIEEVSDSKALCYFKPNSPAEDQDFCKLGMKDGWGTQNIAPNAYFSWPSQPGKWMDVVFFFDSDFRSGTYTQIQAGGVSISDGTTVTTADAITLAANTRAIIAPLDVTRKVSIIENKTGSDLYVGDVNVDSTGLKEGIIVPDGGNIEWRNAAALYGISTLGGTVKRMDEA